MNLPPAQPRALSHTRAVTYHGYRRDDGLWDIEAHLRDSKPAPYEVPGEKKWAPHEAIHDMSIRLTVDMQLVVQDIAVAMPSTPHDDCVSTQDPMQAMIGCSLASGWRKAIEERLGREKGCAHLRELLFNMATAAFQTVQATFAVTHPDVPPPHLGKCKSWGFGTKLVQRRYPTFYMWPEKKK
jgi:hypothetical protein